MHSNVNKNLVAINLSQLLLWDINKGIKKKRQIQNFLRFEKKGELTKKRRRYNRPLYFVKSNASHH